MAMGSFGKLHLTESGMARGILILGALARARWACFFWARNGLTHMCA
jgi:hypothetical protein